MVALCPSSQPILTSTKPKKPIYQPTTWQREYCGSKLRVMAGVRFRVGGAVALGDEGGSTDIEANVWV
ncbi:hypothetical protein CVT26_007153 [Gymnopilus dilepis]|uniref:Uncharacterized protein n=1 Tax=Gymnopilus dilepis TaxID=231916 RepID=A0A409W6L9_9AGAR|nr:hypothetical protein CVT26_007153 [Gymnopilus dilepis]